MAVEELRDFDNDRLIGIVSAKLKFSEELAMTVGQLEYELDRVRKANETNKKLLNDIRQKMYYQNNMEVVKMIDDRRADV